MKRAKWVVETKEAFFSAVNTSDIYLYSLPPELYTNTCRLNFTCSHILQHFSLFIFLGMVHAYVCTLNYDSALLMVMLSAVLQAFVTGSALAMQILRGIQERKVYLSRIISLTTEMR